MCRLSAWTCQHGKTAKPIGTTKTVLEQYWGQNARISEILTDKASPGEIKNMAKMAQYHTRYNASMVSDSLVGVTNLDAKATLMSDEARRPVLNITLCEVFLLTLSSRIFRNQRAKTLCQSSSRSVSWSTDNDYCSQHAQSRTYGDNDEQEPPHCTLYLPLSFEPKDLKTKSSSTWSMLVCARCN